MCPKSSLRNLFCLAASFAIVSSAMVACKPTRVRPSIEKQGLQVDGAVGAQGDNQTEPVSGEPEVLPPAIVVESPPERIEVIPFQNNGLRFSEDSVLFARNGNTPADLNQRILDRVNSAFHLFKPVFDVTFKKASEVKLTQILVLEGSTTTLSGEMAVNSTVPGAAGSGNASVTAVSSPYQVRLTFADGLDSTTTPENGELLQYPNASPLTFDGQKELNISTEFSAQVSGLDALPPQLKKLVASLVTDVSVGLTSKGSFKREGSVYAADLDYKRSSSQSVSAFTVSLIRDVITPLCVKLRTKRNLSTKECMVKLPSVDDPIKDAEASIEKWNRMPTLRFCEFSGILQQLQTLPIYYTYFSTASNTAMKNTRMNIYQKNGNIGWKLWPNEWGTLVGAVSDKTKCPGMLADEQCYLVRMGSRNFGGEAALDYPACRSVAAKMVTLGISARMDKLITK